MTVGSGKVRVMSKVVFAADCKFYSSQPLGRQIVERNTENGFIRWSWS